MFRWIASLFLPRSNSRFRAGKPAFGGTEVAETAVRAGKPAFGGTDRSKSRFRAGKRPFGGTEVAETAVRAEKRPFAGTDGPNPPMGPKARDGNAILLRRTFPLQCPRKKIFKKNLQNKNFFIPLQCTNKLIHS